MCSTALRYMVRTGGQWRYMPNDLPPWNGGLSANATLDSGPLFETMVEDLRMLLREFAGRKAQPTAMILDSRTLQSTPESGARAGYDGARLGARARRFMRRSIRWGICWPCM